MPVASTFGATGGVAVNVSAADQVFGRTTRYVWVGGAGNLAVNMDDGSAVTFLGIQAGTMLEIQVTAVKNSGTTATNVVALF